jgi:AAHS family benzoate transporter-like MFS transporter
MSPPRPAAAHRAQPAVIALCMVITVIEGYNLIVFGSVVPLLVADAGMGITDQQIGLIGGLVYIGAIVGALLAPVLAQRAGRKRVLLLAIGVFALGALLTGLSTSGGMLAAARFLTGLGVGGALTTAMTVARNSAPPQRGSLVVTITMAGIPLGGVVAALLAIPVLPAFGWRPMFVAGAGLALAILVAVAAMTLPTDTPQDLADRSWSGADKLRVLFAGRGAVVAVVIAACAVANMVAWQGLNVWAAQSMVDLGFSLTTALLLTFVLTAAAVLGSFATATAADRRGSAAVAVVTSACTLVGLVAVLLLPVSLPGVVVAVALMGIGGHSTMNLVHTTTSDIYPLPARAAALGWSNGTSFIGAFLGPALGGAAIAAGGARGVFSTFAVAAAVCLAAVVALWGADRRSTAATFRVPVADAPPLVPA